MMPETSPYPSEETLDAIRNWTVNDLGALMDFIAGQWSDYGWFRRQSPKLGQDDGRYYCCATGGWSGNEALLEALWENRPAFAMLWAASWRGGYHEFHLPAGWEASHDRE